MKICIVGDSWGCGEWDSDPKGNHWNSHKGLEHFLSQKHEVTNISVGGINNDEAYRRLTIALGTQSFDYVFWFMTDPLRDLRPYDWFKQKNISLLNPFDWFKQNISFDDLLSEQNKCMKASFAKFNSIGIPIQCIGGCAKLDLNLIQKYSNLTPFIPSVIEFLLPNYTHSEVWFSDWYKFIGKQFDLESLDKLVELKNKQDLLGHEHKDLFYPDGLHPNRYGHELLYNKVVEVYGL